MITILLTTKQFTYTIQKTRGEADLMLNEFLVLGQVPGTDFQITFNEWLSAAILVFLLFIAYKKRLYSFDIKYFWLYSLIYISVRRTNILAYLYRQDRLGI